MAANQQAQNGSNNARSGSKEIFVGPYKRLDTVGQGSFAVVYKGVHPENKSLVAIKTIQHSALKGKLRQNLFHEINIMKQIRHPHIIALINIFESTNHMHLIMEFCQFGDLAMFVRKRDKLYAHPVTADMIKRYPNSPDAGFHEVVVRHFAQQIASALEFIRARDLVHRDLKPQNLLLNPPPAQLANETTQNKPFEVTEQSLHPAAGLYSLPFLKIADFGFARHLPQTAMAETLCGSPLYMAPEILRYEKYDSKADLWSVGTVLYELCVGRPPFKAANHVELLRRIEKTDDNIRFPESLPISDNMQSCIKGLLRRMPTDRMSWNNFFKHAVITDEIPGLVEPDVPKRRTSVSQLPVQQGPSRHSSEEQIGRQEQARPKVSTRQSSTVGQSDRTPPQSPLPGRRPSTDGIPQQRQRRPSLLSHPTAPAAQNLRGEKRAAIDIPERKRNAVLPSPGTSAPREQARVSPRTQEKHLKETREKAAQDIAFERDYVMVEKRAVEVNAFADELAANPHMGAGKQDGPNSAPGNLIRRATTANTGHANTSRQIQLATRPDQLHQRNPSYERRYGPKTSSATSALATALNMVNFRLYGIPFSPSKGNSLPQGYGPFPAFPSAPSGPFSVGDVSRPLQMDEDQRVLSTMEDSATRSDVVYGFAEVKYKQLIPVAPSNENALGIRPPSQQKENEEASDDDDDLTVDAVITIAEEALVLYVKSLSILSKTINLAGNWWSHRTRGEASNEMSGSPKSLDSAKSAMSNLGNRVNNVVQWARNRFNECLEKSEYVSRRLTEAQQKLPENHSLHRRSRSDGDQANGESGLMFATGITAGKLMFDRAIEMSRGAAVNEAMNEDLRGCELSYRTAIGLLEAVLENDDEPTITKSGTSGKAKADDTEESPIDGIEDGDRKDVQKMIEQMGKRLASTRKRIEMSQQQAAARRNSIKQGSTPPYQSTGNGAIGGRTPPR